MDENKELNTELTEEVVEEVVEEKEEMETRNEEVAEDVIVTEPAYEKEYEAEVVAPERKSSTGIIFTIIACVISLVIVVFAFITSANTNKYNNMGYVDIYGQTVQDMADAEGCSLEDFLEIYELPADMPADTNSNAAENMIPTKVYAEEMTKYLDSIKSFVGINENVSNFELFKLISGMPAEVTEDTPIGEAKGMVKLKYIVQDEAELEEFRQKYGFDESVTLETEYKEIRNFVDNYTKKKYEEQKALEEEMMKQLQQMAEQGAIEELEVVPAE